MQGVASKTPRTMADMEGLAQEHVWYCNAFTMHPTSLPRFSCLCQCFLCAPARMLTYLSTSPQRKSLGRDPTLAEASTQKSEDRSGSRPPDFSTQILVRCSCYMFVYVHSIGRDDCCSSPPLYSLYDTQDKQISISALKQKNRRLTTCCSLSPHGGIVLEYHACYEEVVWVPYTYM